MIQPGHGTFLLRTDGDTAEYKMVTLREIVPGTVTAVKPRAQLPRKDGIRLEVLPQRLRDGISGAVDAVSPSGRIANYHMLGWVVIGAMALTLLQMANVDRMVRAGAR